MPQLKTREVDGETIFESSGNLWYDLGYPDAEERHAKAMIGLAIRRRIEGLGITQAEAAKILGVTQPRISQIFNLRVQGYSMDKLSGFLLRLGARVRYNIDFPSDHGSFQVFAP